MPDATPHPRSPSALLARAKEAIERAIEGSSTEGLPAWRVAEIRAARIAYRSIVRFFADGCALRAAALTYVTALSIVPLLAFAFALAKGLGAYELLYEKRIAPFLDSNFGPADAPLSPQGAELRATIEAVLNGVQHTSVGELGPIALIFLALAAIKLLSSVEKTFNAIFGVRRARGLMRKVADYFAILTVAPTLVVIATGITALDQVRSSMAWLESNALVGPLASTAVFAAPLVGLWIGFGFLYACLPNTHVRLRSAMTGGVVAGTMWQVTQILHMEFQVGLASYNAVYAGFGAIPIFLAWLYASWSVTLFGAEVSAACESGAGDLATVPPDLSPADREAVGLSALLAVAERFERGGGGIGASELARALAQPSGVIGPVLTRLASTSLLVESAREAEPTFSLGRPARAIRVADVLRALRGERSGGEGVAAGALGALEAELERLPANRTLADLLPEVTEARVEAPVPARAAPSS